jgi:hypothetical protein
MSNLKDRFKAGAFAFEKDDAFRQSSAGLALMLRLLTGEEEEPPWPGVRRTERNAGRWPESG